MSGRTQTASAAPPAPPQVRPEIPEAARRPGTLHLLGRHQMASVVTTGIDFGTMTALVQLHLLPPALATLAGACLGAVVNFLMGRQVFRAGRSSAGPQAVRYAMVSAASAGFNALGVYALHDRAHVQYQLARAFVAVVVSLLWNFPLQRSFVFRDRARQDNRQ